MRPILIWGLIVAIRVGSLLTLINQFERVVAAEPLNWWKMGLRYIVPFCVSMSARPRASIQVKRAGRGLLLIECAGPDARIRSLTRRPRYLHFNEPHDRALMQEVSDVSKREWKSDIYQDAKLNDFERGYEVAGLIFST